MSKAREKLIALAFKTRPNISKENAESVADEILEQERSRIRKESHSGFKSKIKRLAGLKT